MGLRFVGLLLLAAPEWARAHTTLVDHSHPHGVEGLGLWEVTALALVAGIGLLVLEAQGQDRG